MLAQPADCEKLLLFINLIKIHPTTLLFSIESGSQFRSGYIFLYAPEPGFNIDIAVTTPVLIVLEYCKIQSFVQSASHENTARVRE